MSLPKLAVRRPITTVMALICILIIAGIALTRMRLAFLPEVDAPFIGVQIPYPNSNPWQIEREITKPVEETLATLSGIKKLHSSSNADSAGCPSLRWRTDGSMPIARSARIPPAPSTAYWARRMARLPS